MHGDFATAVQKIIALGFNTVKLPFSFPILANSQPGNVSTACATSSAQDIQVSLMIMARSCSTWPPTTLCVMTSLELTHLCQLHVPQGYPAPSGDCTACTRECSSCLDFILIVVMMSSGSAVDSISM